MHTPYCVATRVRTAREAHGGPPRADLRAARSQTLSAIPLAAHTKQVRQKRKQQRLREERENR